MLFIIIIYLAYSIWIRGVTIQTYSFQNVNCSELAKNCSNGYFTMYLTFLPMMVVSTQYM